MLRKTVMALVAGAALALAIAPTEASARAHAGWGGHPGWGHAAVVRGGFHRFAYVPHRPFLYRPFFHRRFFAGGYPYYVHRSCWRWVPGPWGLRRVWACGYRPYAFYRWHRYY
jgi:hypothetical protein